MEKKTVTEELFCFKNNDMLEIYELPLGRGHLDAIDSFWSNIKYWERG